MRSTTRLLFGLSLLVIATACTPKSTCDQNMANNKLLALGKVSARLIAKGGEVGHSVASRLSTESGVVSELIAKGEYLNACKKADEIAAQEGLNLENEMKDMISIEQLARDGGKGQGNCSVADAAKRQMELHGLMQTAIDQGTKTSDIFRQYNDDSKDFAHFLATDPSAACELLDHLQAKYGL